ncbi:molybdopterin-containing oxidoreductase family protein [Zhaonella formicivorans]|uniref:molybdopterin-containing oxidoreductase family protein n=1 Tax=Zhaonella formicivorans TaxID=2528593 RepID=UPI001D11C479|nr:molybdopterin-dependent oxidoreductase [Zhaonella formicivorans]
MRQEILTFCPLCAGHCSAKATVENGEIINWEPDFERGFPCEPCPPFKGKANMEIAKHPDRLKYPLKRVGAKGEGKWERISWDEALGTIAEKLTKLKETYGPECVSLVLGEPKGLEFAFAQRFASVFGTPNVATPSSLCGATMLASSAVTFGSKYPTHHHDMSHLPNLHIIWGANSAQTRGPLVREWLRASLLKGSKLVVIDPKKIDIAKRADLWIRPRPGSDAALAMGILKVTIEENLYDKDFVARLTVGFDALLEEVKKFTLDDVEKVTWVPKEQIQQVARMYANHKPAVIHQGNAISHGMKSFQTNRCIDILRGISGPPNTPAWDATFTGPPYNRMGRFILLKQFPRKPEKTLGSEYKWALATAYIPHHALLKGILEEKPFPIKAAMVIVSNPLSSYPDARRAYEAFKKLEFVVVADLFMTPTAHLADIILPAATSGEHDTIGYWGEDGALRAFPKLVDPPGEAWPDIKWINELAKRLGLQEYFWANEQGGMEYMMEPSGLTWEEFKEKGLLPVTKQERELQEGSFDTPSGKIEIYSKQMQDVYGYSPVPMWEEVSSLHLQPSEQYPLLLTNRCEDAYKLTSFKHVEYLRNYKPEPEVEMHPETAKKLGLNEGDWVTIETKKGKIRQKLVFDPDLDPRVIYVSFGWWFPEKPNNMFEWDKSNLNILLDNEPVEPATGTVETRGVPCRVYKG